MFSNINITKIVNSLSNTLNIANKLIPLYENTKPMINNARNAFKILKNINLNNINKNNNIKIKENYINKKDYQNKFNNPVFFH